MSKQLNDKKLKALYHRVGLKHGLRDEDIKKIAESPYDFAREKINKLDLNSIQTEEDFNNTGTNFIFKYLGKLYTNFSVINRKHKQSQAFKLINEKKKWEK